MEKIVPYWSVWNR